MILHGQKNFDVIVIGGGIVGLTIAYLISEKNAVRQDIEILTDFTPFKKGDRNHD